jgi:hypothetical protein
MKLVYIVITILLLGHVTGLAQVDGASDTTSGIAVTSPLGMAPVPQTFAPAGPIGIPLGATELASPGISPIITDPLATTSPSVVCPTGSLPGESGTIPTSPFDGGGIGPGMVTAMASRGKAACKPETPMSSVTPMAPSTGVPRTGLPLGSTEIENSGVSPLIVVPGPNISDSPMEMPN